MTSMMIGDKALRMIAAAIHQQRSRVERSADVVAAVAPHDRQRYGIQRNVRQCQHANDQQHSGDGWQECEDSFVS